MTTTTPDGFASLGMYPFDEVRSSFDEIWAAVHHRVPSTPAVLDWDVDLHASWRSPELVVGHTCGWPLVTQLRDLVRVVGAFVPAVPQAIGATYRSVLVAREHRPLHEFRGAEAAVNGLDSLSGWVSLVTAVEGAGAHWTGTLQVTGAHVNSLAAVRDGAAELASIDSVTYGLARRYRPQLVDGLVEVGEGPQVPCLPVIASGAATDDQVDDLRAAFVAAVAERAVAAERALVVGFEPKDLADYLPLLTLTPAT